MSDVDWHFEWPSGYVRYRDGKREVWQDSYGPAARLRVTDAERAAVTRAIETLEGVKYIDAFSTENDATAAATLRGLLERTK